MTISDTLSKIKKQADALSAKTDAFNTTLDHIEAELRGSGIEFWWHAGPMYGMHLSKTDEEIEREYHVLGYTKIGNEWHLAIQRWVDRSVPSTTGTENWSEPENSEPVALARTSRALRIEIAPDLERFLEALSAQIDKMTVAVDNANALVSPTRGGHR